MTRVATVPAAGTPVAATGTRAAALATAGRAVLAGVGSGAVLQRAVRSSPPGGAARWQRTNHRGEPVTLLEGPVAAVAAVLGVLAVPSLPRRWRLAATGACVGAGAFGMADDLLERAGERSAGARGLRGHVAALRAGRVTTGAVKVAGIGAVGLLAAAAAPSGARTGAGRALDVAVSGALVAGTANLVNLFDLRPGRALKVVLLAAAVIAHPPATAPPHPVAQAVLPGAAAGAALAVLPGDLAERSMLGDTGANALGALLGVALLARCGRRGRVLALSAVTALTLASERVSFSRVIAATPGLRELDALGRRPAA